MYDFIIEAQAHINGMESESMTAKQDSAIEVEIEIFSKIVKTLNTLDESTRTRVVLYLNERFGRQANDTKRTN